MPLTGDILTETFENATDYDNAGWTSIGTVDPNYTGTVLDGTQSLLMDGSSSDAYLFRPVTARSSVYAYFKFRLPNLPSNNSIIFYLYDAGYSNILVRLFISDTAHPWLWCGSSEVTAIGQILANTTYHFWLTYIKGTGSNAVANVGFSTSGIRPTSGNNYVNITNGTATTDFENVQLVAQHTGGTFTPIFDRLVLNTTQIGDATAATNVSVDLTGVAASPAIGTGALKIIGTFNPATVSGLTVWLKADSILAGNGDPVSPWVDVSGGGNHGTIVGTPAPTVRTNALNGLPVVRFTVNEGRVRGNTGILSSGLPAPGYNWTIIYIGRMVGPNVGRIFAGAYPTANFLLGYHTTGQDVAYDNGWLGTAQPYTVLPTLWRVWSFTGEHNGSVYANAFYKDGGFIAGAATGGGLQGRYMLSGYDETATSETCDGEVAELLIYNHALSTADRQAVERYLFDKYLNVLLTGVAANPQIGVGTVVIEAVAPPDQGLVAGGGHWYGIPEDEKVYLTGVAASPEVGKVTAIARGTLDDLARRFPFPRPPRTPRRIKRLVPPKPIQQDVFIYPTPFLRLKSAVGIGKVNAFYEEIDEETIMMIDLL